MKIMYRYLAEKNADFYVSAEFGILKELKFSGAKL